MGADIEINIDMGRPLVCTTWKGILLAALCWIFEHIFFRKVLDIFGLFFSLFSDAGIMATLRASNDGTAADTSSMLLLMLGSMADELTGWSIFMFSIRTSSSCGTWHNKFRAAAQLRLNWLSSYGKCQLRWKYLYLNTDQCFCPQILSQNYKVIFHSSLKHFHIFIYSQYL